MGGWNRDFALGDVQACLARHHPVYRFRVPHYQLATLQAFSELREPKCRTVLDVGSGSGVLAQAMYEIFELDRVVAVDVVSRFAASLTIPTSVFDGRRLPFADGSFDCVTLMNVIHHVPPGARPALLQECRRVAGEGPILIKDHLSTGLVDDVRLAFLDLVGNLPFGGMVHATYLHATDWSGLAESAGSDIVFGGPRRYRSGAMGWIAPNRLEIALKLCARATRAT